MDSTLSPILEESPFPKELFTEVTCCQGTKRVYEENLEKVLTSFRERNALIEEIGEVLDSGEFTLVLLDSTNLSRSTFKRIDGVEMYLDSAKRSLELLDLGFKYND